MDNYCDLFNDNKLRKMLKVLTQVVQLTNQYNNSISVTDETKTYYDMSTGE